MNLSTTVKSIQDIMRKDAGVDGDAQRISQLVWLFFLKIFDATEVEAELLQEDFRDTIPEGYRWRDWADNSEGITGDALLEFVNGRLIPTLKALPDDERNGRVGVVREFFSDTYNYMKNGTLLRQVINRINEIDFTKKREFDLFGAVYEQILSSLQGAGNAGEYYTPRAVTKFMVTMTDPRLGETVLDPACGTGGFLTSAIDHIRDRYVQTPDDERALQATIQGIEKKPLPYSLCITNMLLHKLDVPTTIRHENALAKPLVSYGPADRVDVIITNPPFGGMEEDGIENNFPGNFRTRETADLFLVMIIRRLKNGGRGAIVLPDGTLFGEGIKTRVKEHLLSECNLHTIVRLPNGVFAPYTGIKTNLLFFTKGEPTREVWYYEHPYPAGYKNYSKTKPIRFEEFAPEQAWWNRREEIEVAWRVSIEQIKAANYNLDSKNPNRLAEDSHDPAELLVEYQRLSAQVADLQALLRAELLAALEGEPAQ